jgi:hypothetical protein
LELIANTQKAIYQELISKKLIQMRPDQQEMTVKIQQARNTHCFQAPFQQIKKFKMCISKAKRNLK